MSIRRLLSRNAFIVVFIAGCALPLAYAPLNALPVFYLAYACLFHLAWALRRNPSRLFMLGWLFGFGQFLTGLYWIGSAFLVEADRFGWALPFAITLLPAGLAVFPALALALWGLGLKRFGRYASRFAPVAILWLVLLLSLADYGRGVLLTGLPWNLPVMAYGGWEVLAQLVAFIGIYGTGLVALLGVAAAWAAVALPRARRRALVVALAVPVFVAALGFARLTLTPTPPDTDLNLLVVQPHIPQAEKWKPENRQAVVAKTFDLTARGFAAHPESALVVWPETALPVLLDEGPEFARRLAAHFPSGRLLLTGAHRRDGTRRYNSVFVYEIGAGKVAQSDKYHLVPFGEYLPFAALLKTIGLETLTHGGYSAGSPHPLLTHTAMPPTLPLICYEAAFPLPRSARRARWLLNVTNDAWFGATAGPYQHLAHARLRAVETGLPLVRAANTGISAVFDGFGRARAALPLGAEGFLATPLPAPTPPTLYAIYGETLFWFLWGAGALAAACWARKRLSGDVP